MYICMCIYYETYYCVQQISRNFKTQNLIIQIYCVSFKIVSFYCNTLMPTFSPIVETPVIVYFRNSLHKTRSEFSCIISPLLTQNGDHEVVTLAKGKEKSHTKPYQVDKELVE